MYDYKLFDEIKAKISKKLKADPNATFEQDVLEKEVGLRKDSPKFRLHLRWFEEKGLLELQDTPDGYLITPTDKGIILFENENFSFARDNIEEDNGRKEIKKIKENSIEHLERNVKWVRPMIWLSVLSFIMALFCLLKLYDVIGI